MNATATQVSGELLDTMPAAQPLAVVSDSASLMQAVARAASDPSVDVEKMERLWVIYEKMSARQAETEFNAAMSRVQSAMRRIETDARNKQTNSDYATYGQLDRVLRPLYTAEGLSLSFDTEAAAEGNVGMVCYVSHSAGHTRTYRATVPSDGKGAKGGDVMTKTHAFGSGASYGMRYLLKMIFNVALGVDQEDDDGNVAGSDANVPDYQEWFDKIAAADSLPALRKVKDEMLAKIGDDKNRVPTVTLEAYNARVAELTA